LTRFTFSDLAQVLNLPASQLCLAVSDFNAPADVANFCDAFERGLTSLKFPYGYKSAKFPTSLRPTSMLFGCSLPDELETDSRGQLAVFNALETIFDFACAQQPSNLVHHIATWCKDEEQSFIELVSLLSGRSD
jgi:hypothetical protein